ncbi:hypothetical protein DL96DRAFT_1629525 [Flagelloscypha sp. PMI_526]|nr:hypothetical protein DL96DRAFT_1629525 [Flagelloscypha sp. PMI_526]
MSQLGSTRALYHTFLPDLHLDSSARPATSPSILLPYVDFMDATSAAYQLHFARQPSGVYTSRSPPFVAGSPRKSRPSFGLLCSSSESISSLGSSISAQEKAPRGCLHVVTNSGEPRAVPKASVAPCSVSFTTVGSRTWDPSFPTSSLSSHVSVSSTSSSEVHTPPEDLLIDFARQSILRRRKRNSWRSASSSDEPDCAFSCAPSFEAAHHVDFVLPVPPPTPLSASSDSSSSYEDLVDEVQVVFRSCNPRNRAPPTPAPYTTEYCSPTHLYTEFLEEIRASRPPPALIPSLPRVKQVGFDVDEASPIIFAPIPTLAQGPSVSSLTSLLTSSPPPTVCSTTRPRGESKSDLRLRRGGGLRGKKRAGT